MKDDRKRDAARSKKLKLYIANIIVFILLIGCIVFDLLVLHTVNLTDYLLLMVGFIMLSLIVYYISIIADALLERNRRLKERQEKTIGRDRENNND